MAKPKPLTLGDNAVIDAGSQPNRKWASSHGTYIAGRAYMDEADATAAEMEAKWGVGRLRLLVGPDLREKFDRQRYLFNQAVWHGRDMEDVRREAGRMVKAWIALDRAAEAAGGKALDPLVWEVALSDGTVAAFVRSLEDAHAVVGDGRRVNVYTLEEVGRLLEANSLVSAVKLVFPGAKVEAARREVSDPLDAMDDSQRSIDEPFPNDEIPF